MERVSIFCRWEVHVDITYIFGQVNPNEQSKVTLWMSWNSLRPAPCLEQKWSEATRQPNEGQLEGSRKGTNIPSHIYVLQEWCSIKGSVWFSSDLHNLKSSSFAFLPSFSFLPQTPPITRSVVCLYSGYGHELNGLRPNMPWDLNLTKALLPRKLFWSLKAWEESSIFSVLVCFTIGQRSLTKQKTP